MAQVARRWHDTRVVEKSSLVVFADIASAASCYSLLKTVAGGEADTIGDHSFKYRHI